MTRKRIRLGMPSVSFNLLWLTVGMRHGRSIGTLEDLVIVNCLSKSSH
ncbi:hypothetical protein ABR965_21850 [Photorhabdus laumondii]